MEDLIRLSSEVLWRRRTGSRGRVEWGRVRSSKYVAVGIRIWWSPFAGRRRRPRRCRRCPARRAGASGGRPPSAPTAAPPGPRASTWKRAPRAAATNNRWRRPSAPTACYLATDPSVEWIWTGAGRPGSRDAGRRGPSFERGERDVERRERLMPLKSCVIFSGRKRETKKKIYGQRKMKIKRKRKEKENTKPILLVGKNGSREILQNIVDAYWKFDTKACNTISQPRIQNDRKRDSVEWRKRAVCQAR